MQKLTQEKRLRSYQAESVRKIKSAVHKMGGTYIPVKARGAPLGFAIVDGVMVRFTNHKTGETIAVSVKDKTDDIILKVRQKIMERRQFFYKTFEDFASIRYRQTMQLIHDKQLPPELAFVLGVLATSYGDKYVATLIETCDDLEMLREQIKNFYV